MLLLDRRGEETNIGNFIADSMVDWVSNETKSIYSTVIYTVMLLELQYSERTATNTSWSSVSASFLNSGGIRGAFSVGDITVADLLTVLPFENTVDVVDIRGDHLRGVFSQVADRMNADPKAGSAGGFLQVSGGEDMP